MDLLGQQEEVEVMGRVVTVRAQFACVATMIGCEEQEIPESMKAAFRVTAPLDLDISLVAEALLLSCGYTEAQAISRKLSSILHHMSVLVRLHTSKIAV